MKDLCSCGTEKDRRAKQCRSCSGQKLRTNFKCTVDGCEKDAWSSGLCSMHLRRVKRHGDVDKVLWGPESEAWNLRTPITPNSYGVCWEWTGYLFNKGEIGREYGGVFLDGKRRLVHRLAWEAVNGPIPKSTEVCHKCDNPKCWRPDHLFLGSHKDNMDDRDTKGRNNPNFAIGFRLPQTKLSEDDILEIRELHSSGIKQCDLAKKFGVSPGYISSIVNNKSRIILDQDRTYKTLNRKKIWDGSGGFCGICGEPVVPTEEWHIDHIIPLSRGGSDTYCNVQVSHPLCNWKKSNQIFVLWPIT